MLPMSTGAVGDPTRTLPTSSRVLPPTYGQFPGRTWHVSSRTPRLEISLGHVAPVVERVSVHVRAATRSYLVRFFTRRGCGRSHSSRCPRRPACCRAHLVLLPGPLGTRPVSSRLLPGSVLPTLFLPPTSGVHDVQRFSRVRVPVSRGLVCDHETKSRITNHESHVQ